MQGFLNFVIEIDQKFYLCKAKKKIKKNGKWKDDSN